MRSINTGITRRPQQSPLGSLPVMRTGEHPWLHLGWKILPTKCARRFRCKGNSVDLMRVQYPTIACGMWSLVADLAK